MERLFSRSLQQSLLKLLKKQKLQRTSIAHSSQIQKIDQSFLAHFKTIEPDSSSLCHKCLASRLDHFFLNRHKELSSAFEKQVRAVTSLLLKSTAPSGSKTSITVSPWAWFSTSSGRHQSNDNRDRGAQDDRSRRNDDDKKDEENEEDDESKRMTEFMRSLYTFISVLLLAWLLSPGTKDKETAMKYISWSEFYHNLLLKGEVKNITIHYSTESSEGNVAVVEVHEGAVVKGQVALTNTYLIKIPKGFHFEEMIRQAEEELGIPLQDRVPIQYKYPNSWVMVVMNLAVVIVLLFFLRQIFSKFTMTKDGNPMDMMDVLSGGMRKAKYTRVDVGIKGETAISFKDVAGLREAKVEVTEFVDYLTKPQRFKDLGAKTPRGALLLGPPGCGKTLLARALATEAKVPFLAMAGSEFVEMIGGVGAARVRNLFKEARNKAPCIIYIDEIDAIGRSRGGSASVGGEDEHTLNQLLVEMDGIGTQEGVIVLAATNRADILDKALLRPGRFDRHIMIDLPTLAEREEIFTVYLNKLKLAMPASNYAKPLSKLTPGMSGADIANICNEAAIHAARDARSLVDKDDFEYAVERVIAGVEKKTRLLSPSEKKVVAYHESGHALVGWMLKYTDALLRISIVPRTNSALGFAQYLPSDQKLYSKEELFERMCMALGGRAAESLIFNHVSTGAHDDLQRVTKMAYDQIKSFGMNEKIGNLAFPTDEENRGVKPYSQRLATTIDEEARSLVAKAFLHTQSVLKEHKDKLKLLATTLLEREVLNYDDIEKLIGPPPQGKKHVMEPHGWEGIMPSNGNDNRRKNKM